MNVKAIPNPYPNPNPNPHPFFVLNEGHRNSFVATSTTSRTVATPVTIIGVTCELPASTSDGSRAAGVRFVLKSCGTATFELSIIGYGCSI